MDSAKITRVALMYEKQLRKLKVRKKRMKETYMFAHLNGDEILSHALHLCGTVREYARSPGTLGKANRHLGSLQTCLSFAGLYTLAELMRHNAP